MKKRLKKIFKFIIAFFVTVSFVPLAAKPIVAEQADEVTILFTHDLHDQIIPFVKKIDEKKQSVGGFSRLKTAIEIEREKDPEALLVDAGDYAMGTLFQTIFSTHAPTLQLMGEIGFDAVTFGNHEFDFRAEGLAASLNAAKQSGNPVPPIVSANMIFPVNESGNMEPSVQKLKEAADDYGVTPYKIIERKGYKIGIFGLLGDDAISTAPLAGVEFSDMIASAKEVVAELKEAQVDLIVALSHSGTNDDSAKSEDEILAKEVPEIDVIVSGHTHTLLREPIIVNDTIIGSIGEFGQNLGVLKLKPKDNGRWELSDYELVSINENIAQDEALTQSIEQFKQVVESEYLTYFDLEFDQVLANTSFDFPPHETMEAIYGENRLGNLIGDAFIYTVNQHDVQNNDPITAAVVPVGTIRNTFYEGEITVAQAFSVSSLGIGPDKVSGYPIVEVYLTGKELKTIAEVDASVSPIMQTAQLHVAGLSYTVNPNRLMFNKVLDVKIQQRDGSLEEIVDDKLYRVVAGLYSGQMLPVVSEKSFGLLSLVPKKKDGTPIEDFEEHIIYMNDGSNREIKEWYALANYLASFEKQNGIPQVPETYAETENRKIVNDSKNIWELVKKPNGITLSLYATVLILLLSVVSIFYFRKKRRKAKQKKGAA